MKLDGWTVRANWLRSIVTLTTETESCTSSCDSILTLMMSQQLEVYVMHFNGLKRIVCTDESEDLKNRWEPINFRRWRFPI
jgi:hypothetical protein